MLNLKCVDIMGVISFAIVLLDEYSSWGICAAAREHQTCDEATNLQKLSAQEQTIGPVIEFGSHSDGHFDG